MATTFVNSKLRKSVKTKWLKALRSGAYKQGEGELKSPNGEDATFCCLGVLCDIHRKSVKKKGKVWKRSDSGYSYDDESGVLPNSVISWAFGGKVLSDDEILALQDPVIKNSSGSKSLAVMNDSGRYNFKKIANAIEKHL